MDGADLKSWKFYVTWIGVVVVLLLVVWSLIMWLMWSCRHLVTAFSVINLKLKTSAFGKNVNKVSDFIKNWVLGKSGNKVTDITMRESKERVDVEQVMVKGRLKI